MRTRRTIQLATASGFSLAICLAPASADQNWDGDNPFGNFSYANNWYGGGGGVFPTWGAGAGSLYFNYRNNSSQTSLYYDLSWSYQTNDIIWESTFGAGLPWNGNGTGLNFNQRLENRSSHTQTVNIPLSGAKNGAGQIELNPVNGNLVVQQPIYNDNHKPYVVYGANLKTLTLSGSAALFGGSSAHFTIDTSSNNTVQMNATGLAYGGETRIYGGKLLVNGSKTGSGNVTVANSTTLGGSGAVAGNVTLYNSARLTGGDVGTAGKLSLSGNVSFDGGSSTHKLQLDIGSNATPGVTFDQIALTGTGKNINLNNTNLVINVIGAINIGTYRIIDATTTQGGSGNSRSNLFTGITHNTEYTLAGSGNSVKYKVFYGGDYVDLSFTAVPEPTSFGLLAVGVGWMVSRRNRKKQQ